MGVSTDGILVFGIDLIDYEGCKYFDLPFADPDDDDFEHTIARLAGCKQYPEEGYYQEQRAAYDAQPLALVHHCSCDYPMYILALKGTETTAPRGYPAQIEALDTGDHTDTQALLEFARKYGIEGEPKWLLCSMWC